MPLRKYFSRRRGILHISPRIASFCLGTPPNFVHHFFYNTDVFDFCMATFSICPICCALLWELYSTSFLTIRIFCMVLYKMLQTSFPESLRTRATQAEISIFATLISDWGLLEWNLCVWVFTPCPLPLITVLPLSRASWLKIFSASRLSFITYRTA